MAGKLVKGCCQLGVITMWRHSFFEEVERVPAMRPWDLALHFALRRPWYRRNFNETARYVDQGGGRRKSAFAMYLEPELEKKGWLNPR